MTKKCETGNSRSIEELSGITRSFIENSVFLKRFLKRFLLRQQDIEDVVQETFLKAYSAEQDKTIEQPKSYLFTIAKNIAVNELKKKSHQITEYLEECSPAPVHESSPTPEQEMEAQQVLGVYCDAVATLPEACRRVFLLRRVHGLPQSEIASMLGISVRMVQKHLHKGGLKCHRYIHSKQQEEKIANGTWRDRLVPTEGGDV